MFKWLFQVPGISTRQPSKKARSTGIHLEQGTVKRPRHGLAHDRDCLACCSSILQSTCPGFQKKPVQVAEPDFDNQKFQKSVFQVPKKALQNAPPAHTYSILSTHWKKRWSLSWICNFLGKTKKAEVIIPCGSSLQQESRCVNAKSRGFPCLPKLVTFNSLIRPVKTFDIWPWSLPQKHIPWQPGIGMYFVKIT